MVTLNRSQMIIIYGFTLLLVHLSTNGFRTNAPIVYVAPLISLCVMAVCTRMKASKKLATIGSFLSIMVGIYYWALLPKFLIARALLFCLSNFLYCSTFAVHVRKYWTPLAVFVAIYCTLLLYYSVADLYRSLPGMVLAVAADLVSISFSVVAAGSLWWHGVAGNRIHEAKTAALLRFIGVCIELVCGTAMLNNHFLTHNNFHQYMLLYYIAQFLLFVANEQTF